MWEKPMSKKSRGRRRNGRKKPGVVEAPKRMGLWKRVAIGAGVIAAIAGAGALSYCALSRPDESYVDQRTQQVVAPVPTNIGRIASLDRQSFLTELVANANIPFCAGVVYDPTGDKLIAYSRNDLRSMGTAERTIDVLLRPYEKRFGDGNYRAKTPDVFDLSGQDRSSKVFVGRKLFEKSPHYTDEDLRCILIAHEGRHVHQHAKGLEHLDRDTIVQAFNDGRIHHPALYEIMELDANYHALKRVQTGEFKLSSAYSRNLRETYEENLRKLRSIAKKHSSLQQGLVKYYLDKVKDMP